MRKAVVCGLLLVFIAGVALAAYTSDVNLNVAERPYETEVVTIGREVAMNGTYICYFWGTWTGGASATFETKRADGIWTTTEVPEFTAMTADVPWLLGNFALGLYRLNVSGGTSPSLNFECRILGDN